jgi:hypothetical protein
MNVIISLIIPSDPHATMNFLKQDTCGYITSHILLLLLLLLFVKTANGLLTRWQLYYSKTQ